MGFGNSATIDGTWLVGLVLTAVFAVAERSQVGRSQPPGAFGMTLQSPMLHLLAAVAVGALLVAAALHRRGKAMRGQSADGSRGRAG